MASRLACALFPVGSGHGNTGGSGVSCGRLKGGLRAPLPPTHLAASCSLYAWLRISRLMDFQFQILSQRVWSLMLRGRLSSGPAARKECFKIGAADDNYHTYSIQFYSLVNSNGFPWSRAGNRGTTRTCGFRHLWSYFSGRIRPSSNYVRH